MKNWFLGTVKYQKEDDHGRIKNVTEKYLLDAMSFTEAESKIYEEIGQRVMGEFSVTAISKSNIVDSFSNHIKDTFEDELADVMIRVMDLAAYKGIDLEKHIRAKMRYNALRPHKHGKKY